MIAKIIGIATLILVVPFGIPILIGGILLKNNKESKDEN